MSLLLVYITCDSVKEAKSIGKHLMTNRLAACINIYPVMHSMFFWPPLSGTIAENKEVVLIAKTIESKYATLERAVHKVHSYDVPCVIAIPTNHVSKKYYDWLVSELMEPTQK